jgi:3-oxoacyl-[acyl-carrier-protein] synthase-1
MSRYVAIVGAGARTAVGLDAPSSAVAVRAGIAAMREHPYMLDRQSAPMVVCSDAMLPLTVTGADRLVALALPPALERSRTAAGACTSGTTPLRPPRTARGTARSQQGNREDNR